MMATSGAGGTATAGAGGSTAGGSGGGGGAATDPTVPASIDAATWDAFMTAKSYTMNGWISDVAAPRPASGVSSPHGSVRVWFNPTLVASQDAGNGMPSGTPHTLNSMAVKELYDDAGVLVGHAASLKIAGAGMASWQYYCKAPMERCYTGSPDLTTPLFGAGESNCAFCHGGLVFTQAP